MGQSSENPAVRPVRQARSLKTLHALLDALDHLLRERPFESITVLELAQAAKVSTGAFYARFASKEDLLPELYAHYQRSLKELTARKLDPSNWAPLSMNDRLEKVSHFICDSIENRDWLLRAVAIHSRRRYPVATSADSRSTAQMGWLQRLADCVTVAPAPRDNLPREQLEFALYTAITLAREAILFPHLPMATALGLNARSIRLHLPTLLQRQLGLSPAGIDPERENQ